MKKLSFLLAAAVLAAILAFVLAWTFYPRLSGNADALAAAQRERATLAFFPPQIRTYLSRTDASTRILLNDSVAADAAIAAAREKLDARTAADPDFEKLKTDYLKVGMAKLELVKKVTENYEKFAAANPDFARSTVGNKSVFGDLADSPVRLSISLLAAFLGGLLVLRIAARVSTPTPPLGQGGEARPASTGGDIPVRPLPITPPEPRKLLLSPNVVLELLPVPTGSFERKAGNSREIIPITHPFWLGKYEVTQEQWEAVMGADNNPSPLKGPKLPVSNITWEEATAFCKRVNKLPTALPPKNYHYALPSEYQWEYVALQVGDEEPADESDDENIHDVGEEKPNKWGFYDMCGNVDEICADGFIGYQIQREKDPVAAAVGPLKVVKGVERNKILRVAINQNQRNAKRGFRLALVPNSL